MSKRTSDFFIDSIDETFRKEKCLNKKDKVISNYKITNSFGKYKDLRNV